MSQIRLCSLADQKSLQASKWRQTRVLLDEREMAELLEALAPVELYLPGSILHEHEGLVAHETFLNDYGHYIERLRSGAPLDDPKLTRLFCCLLTRSSEAVYGLRVEGGIIIKPHLPIVQMQAHRLGYSKVDHAFRSMVFGREAIAWGVQFSYPQLFIDPETKAIAKVDRSERFVNSELYQELLGWVRQHTLPTPFWVEGRRVNVPVRLGRNCFRWINNHAQLRAVGLSVKE